jgi:hypothetical protein
MGKVLHASKSGYFPACINEVDSPACVFPLEIMMKIYWRVKRFRVTGSGIGTFPPPFEYLTGTFAFPPFEIFSKPFSLYEDKLQNSEEELVCPSYFETLNPEPPIEYLSVFPLPATNLLFATKNKNNLFALDIDSNFPFEGLLDSGGGYQGINIFFGPYATTSPSTSLNIFGVNMPVYITIDGFGDDAYMGGNLQLTLTPIEYWSYGGTWNTTTGEPL